MEAVLLQDVYGRSRDVFTDHVVEIVTRTRNHPRIELGASPRAGIALVKRLAGQGFDPRAQPCNPRRPVRAGPMMGSSTRIRLDVRGSPPME